MKKLFLLFGLIFTLFGITTNAHAVDYHFTLTTTNQTSSSWDFQFRISAKGTFYVDCGTNGTLSRVSGGSATVSGVTINKTGNTERTTFKCQYTSSGSKTIRFGGTATEYYSGTAGAVEFSERAAYTTPQKVLAISGDLSKIFPFYGFQTGKHPSFNYTFSNCVNLTSIPDTLFSGYTSGGSLMFYHTFDGCTGLTSIPENLFQNITTFSPSVGLSENMFSSTFYGCTGLTSIPPRLFANVTAAGVSMFSWTFANCTNLRGYIPPTLFAGLIANGSPYCSDMMKKTFYNTGLDTSCPSGTPQFITGYEDYWNKDDGGNYAVSCASVSFTWDGVATTPTYCSVGGTFTPPTPAARPGYRFTGWKVKTINP